MVEKIELELEGRTLSIEYGRVAKQAHGAVWMQYGETVVLVATVADTRESNLDFFPLTVDYREKFYASGKIPGNFFKREGAPSTTEKLSARLIDHQIRPLFLKRDVETQVLVTILSFDEDNDPAVLAMNGASAAVCISDIPFEGPIGAVKVGRINGEYVINPTYEQLEESDINIIVSGNKESIISVEGECHEVPDADVLGALRAGQEAIARLVEMQEDLVARCGKPKRVVVEPESDEALGEAVRELAAQRIREANRLSEKEDRASVIAGIEEDVQAALEEGYPESRAEIAAEIGAIVKAEMRRMILEEGRRIDGRDLDEVRPIEIEIGSLPRAHGSALFTRGQTQALCVATLGSKLDTRMVDDLEGMSYKSFMLDYNFPSYSVGETRRIGAPGRREIGHGILAEKALIPAIPNEKHFPYTIRVVSEILESNSSSSMATVCGGSLALMDAGVPVKTAVAGAGVGLVMGEDSSNWALLTDILGAEDHLGDMDLKIAGTAEGLTSIQLDIKVKGISLEIMQEAFGRARGALDHILGKMNEAIARPRPELSPYAPRILSVYIDPSKIGTVIGPGGKTIRRIEETGATVAVEDDGLITVSSVDAAAGEEAMQMIKALVEDPEVGRVYNGTVKRTLDFGAFIEILPGKEGLCHISELDYHRVNKVEDVLSEGDKVDVKVVSIDDQGKVRLSRKATFEPPPGYVEPPPRQSRGPRRPSRR
jgi:polyribonucleotide nucleotidyltransferase